MNLNVLFKGIWIVNFDGYPSDAVGSERDGTCLHIRHPETAAHDHEREWQGPNPDLPELPGPTPGVSGTDLHGPENEPHGLWGDRTDLRSYWRWNCEGMTCYGI